MNKNYAVFPCRNVNITQNYNSAYSHATQSGSTNGVKSYPIDFAWGDTYLMAPCRMKSVKMNGFWNESVLNQVFFHSTEKVHCANGEYDYITILAGHTDDWDYSQDKIGTIYQRGQDMLNQGTDGNVSAHLDIVVALGLQTGWVKNSFGEWVLPNSRKPEDVFYIDPKYNNVINTQGITFKTIPKEYELPNTVLRDENKNQIEVIVDDLNVRKGAGSNNEITFFPCTKGIYDYTEVLNGWYKIKEDMWVNEIGIKFLPKKVEPVIEQPVIEEPIVTEPTTPTENDDIKPVEEDKQEDNTNTTEIEKVPKSGFKLIIYTIIKNILDYLKERYNNDKKNFKGN